MTTDAKYRCFEYRLIQVAPNPVRSEHVNIGVALYDPTGHYAGVRINPDLHRVRTLSAGFDEADLVGLQQELLTRLRSDEPEWMSHEYLFRLASESFSQALRITMPSAVLTSNPEQELEDLYRRYAAPPPQVARLKEVKLGPRGAIRRHLIRVFTEERLLPDYLRRDFRVDELVREPDNYRFDFYYRPDGSHHCIQALPLEGGERAVKELCYTTERLRKKLVGLRTHFEVTSVSNDTPLTPEREFLSAMLHDAGVKLRFLHDSAQLSQDIRVRLGMN